MSGANIETYAFAGATIPGATWADGRPGPARNVPLVGIDPNQPAYLPLDVIMRRTYESNEHGWIEVKGNHNNRAGWRGAKKSRKAAAPKQSLDTLIIGLSGKSYLVV
jgi:hypothetical protein